MNNPQLSRKEETLSDKRLYTFEGINAIPNEYCYPESDVQDFIKKLKEGLFGGVKPMEDNQAIDFIDKLAGKSLI
jgi:hypothetical protein